MLYGCLVPTKSAGKVIEYAFKLISCTVHSWYANGILRSMNGRMSQKGLKHSPSWDGLNNKHTCQPKCNGGTRIFSMLRERERDRQTETDRDRQRERERSVEGGDVETYIRCLICRYQVYAISGVLKILSTFIHHVSQHYQYSFTMS